MKNVLDVLTERGFVKQTVYGDDLRKKLETESISFYVGFDPTADSLHIGHYIPIMAMAWMQKYGHTPIALFGGGTGMVGDPSGRSDMRQMLTPEIINHNIACFKQQMSRFIRFDGENAAIIENNEDWLMKLNYVEFLRDIGVHFSVNKMLTAECFRQRMEKGLTFLEFNYMLMQGYDFLVLNQKHGCVLEVGGDDQWSNMLAGVDLIRRKEQKDAYCLTCTLLLNSEGKKMGKTQKGALWLDEKKCSVYDFYQYFRNVEDVKVAECMRLLTFMEMDEIAELTKYNDERMNQAKERLAFEVTKLVHGEEKATEAQKQAKAAFGGNVEDMPTFNANGLTNVIDIIAASGVAKSKSEARRLIEGNAISVDDKKITVQEVELSDEIKQKGSFVLHKGKKVHINIIL
ncbi:MAG: tyrosine--tRNA ligase [Clostridia bacterium]|nr:tyrosine--tRNA ligase [Clostridia bacterium]